MKDLSIRSATADDIDHIERLLRGLAESLGDPQPYAVDTGALRRYGFGEHRLYQALLAETGGESVGLCIFFPEFSTWRCKPGLYVQDLFVETSRRGAGIGRALLVDAMRRANTAWEAAYLRLAVHMLNRDALQFYQRLGFDADPDNRVMMLTDAHFDSLIDH